MAALMLGSVLGGCAMQTADTPAACAFVKQAEFPVTWSFNTPQVMATLGGKSAVLTVDTGASLSVLSKSAAERLDLPQGYGDDHFVTGIGGGGKTRGVLARHLTLGQEDVGSQIFYIVPYDIKFKETIVEGLLGSDILSHYDVDLDLPHNRIALYQQRNCPGGQPDWGGVQATRLPAGMTLSKGMQVTVRVNGQPITALIDSGSAITVINEQTAAQTGAGADALTGGRTIPTYGAGQLTGSMRLAKFDTFQVGSTTYRPATLGVARMPLALTMLLGENYLRRHRFWMATYTQQAFVSPDMAPGTTVAAAPAPAVTPAR